MGITLNLQKASKSCILITSHQGDILVYVMSLRFAWACIIWAVLLGMTNTNVNE